MTVAVLGACPVHEPRSTEPANDDLVAAWLADLQGMDDADREHDVTVLDTRSLLYRIAADAETIRKQAEEIERLRKQNHESAAKNHTRAQRAESQLQTLQRDMESAKAWLSKPSITGARFSKYIEEGIAGFLHTEWTQEAELATAREQVRTLREALKKLEWSGPNYSEGGIDHGPGCPACGGHKYGTGYAHHEPGGHRKNCYHRAALGSTEPKG